MINITRINHTAINTADDVEPMQQFYTAHLGAKTVKRDIPEEFAALVPGFWMQFENGQVHVIKNAASAVSAKDAPMNPMGPHIAFYVADIKATKQYLADNNMVCESVDEILFTRDPAGNVLEFQQDPDCVNG